MNCCRWFSHTLKLWISYTWPCFLYFCFGLVSHMTSKTAKEEAFWSRHVKVWRQHQQYHQRYLSLHQKQPKQRHFLELSLQKDRWIGTGGTGWCWIRGSQSFLAICQESAILEIWKNETATQKCGIFPPSQESDINHDATIESCWVPHLFQNAIVFGAHAHLPDLRMGGWFGAMIQCQLASWVRKTTKFDQIMSWVCPFSHNHVSMENYPKMKGT